MNNKACLKICFFRRAQIQNNIALAFMENKFFLNEINQNWSIFFSYIWVQVKIVEVKELWHQKLIIDESRLTRLLLKTKETSVL